MFSETTLVETLKSIVKFGYKYKTKKRPVMMYMFGSTCGRSEFPQFHKDGKKKTMPRPYETSRPGEDGRRFIQQAWFTKFVQDIEWAVIHFYCKHHPDKKKSKFILDKIKSSKQNIPPCCRISGTFFSHFTLIGTMEDNPIGLPGHYDKGDIVTALVHIGSPIEGGSTYYKDSTDGKVVKEVKCYHGRLQIGCFDSTFHGAYPWIGARTSINLHLKASVLNHFEEYGCYYYRQLRNSKYQSSFRAY